MRTVVPLTASIFAMPMLLFQMATIASGFVWAFIKLLPGVGLTVLTKGCSGEFFAAGRIKAGASLVYRAWNIPEDVPRSSPASRRGFEAPATGAVHRQAYAVSPLSLRPQSRGFGETARRVAQPIRHEFQERTFDATVSDQPGERSAQMQGGKPTAP
jgi:hypothetical protein